MKKCLPLLLLSALSSGAQASDFCTGIGLFARAGALYRDQGSTEQQALAAVEDGRDKLDADTRTVIRYFVRFGFRGNQTPDEAFASAESKCLQYEAQDAKKRK
ncbi:hypothetical protein [Pseudomonas sp. SCB32]|uniref:hypothetical protein n=1 Tax=Pseudomonas sp. SCB32 TaxID=2653853 RepID=UPI001264D017|nr:hypothetical protein [Pseudomonas sp. SCB32]